MDNAVAAIDRCTFGGSAATIENRPTSLTLRAVNFEGQAVVLKKGVKTQVIITGGLPDYTIELRPYDATKLDVAYVKVAGAHVAELNAVNTADETADFTLFVTDNSSPEATMTLPVRIVP